MPFAQRDGRIELEQRQSVGLFERRQHPHESMSVGVCLHDRQHLRSRGQLARASKIRGQCGKIDLRKERSRHAGGDLGE